MESDWTFRCWNLCSFLHMNISNMSSSASDSILSFFCFSYLEPICNLFCDLWDINTVCFVVFSVYAQWLSWVTVETSWVLSENILLMFIEIVLNLLVEHNKRNRWKQTDETDWSSEGLPDVLMIICCIRLNAALSQLFHEHLMVSWMQQPATVPLSIDDTVRGP